MKPATKQRIFDVTAHRLLTRRKLPKRFEWWAFLYGYRDMLLDLDNAALHTTQSEMPERLIKIAIEHDVDALIVWSIIA